MQGSVEARVIVAGLSTTCSQKIHNQLVHLFIAYIFSIIFKQFTVILYMKPGFFLAYM
jgi:hypothetical protein